MNCLQTEKRPAGPRRAFSFRALALLSVIGISSGSFAHAEEYDALYLNDGSILKGTILEDDGHHFLVYSALGELTVPAEKVIYSTIREETPPVIQETHILIGGTTETLTIAEQDVPKQVGDAKEFRFLAPGTVASIVNGEGEELLFHAREVGDVNIVTIQYGEVPSDTKRIRIALWRFDLLKALGAGKMQFEQKYTPDQEGGARVMVKYPKEWKVESVEPAPQEKLAGLIVWRSALKRQQNFMPKIVFQTSVGSR